MNHLEIQNKTHSPESSSVPAEKEKINHNQIQLKWQKKWQEAELGKSKLNDKPKFYMHFAYPGVSGYQHVGHMRGFSYTDIICRYKTMTGYNVFFPIGVHSTGNQVIGFAKKVERKDEKWINYLIDNGYPEQELDKMKNPEFVVDYFINNYIENWKKFGFLADWNSIVCTTKPDYQKFIQWQFKKLNKLNYLIQEPYIATFCPNCGPIAVDPSETDISKGGTAEKNEYTIIKFKIGNEFIIAATLRPETMYGQTNLWINPEEEYAKIKIKNEIWICSKQCAEKLKNQKDNIEILNETIKGTELIGKYALAPSIEREIIILPSKFTDANIGTGIVTSVPSDAPYDYMALTDLQKNEEEMKKYNLDIKKIKSIKIIPIIKSKTGNMPAVEICKKLKIKNQNDPKLERATKEIYKQGFHTGVLNENCGEFNGKSVNEAKEKMKEKLIQEGKADTMYDLSEEVICRCGANVIIKKIEDQWFIKYSDKQWTEQSKANAEKMNIMPNEYKKNISGILDWFQNRPCARLGNWMGTKLPFDKKWTIEPISDSTLYPAYYIISRYYNEKKITLEEMTEEFFDFIFLEQGQGKETWKEIQQEFNYWYPVDINLGGKEHQTVHFPVYIMNHTAILKPEQQPKGIFVNYWIIGEGGKLSKSKGGANASPKEAGEKYSVDALRLYYSHIASPHIDVEWNEEAAYSYKKHIEKLFNSIKEWQEINGKEKPVDEWIISKANSKLKEYNKAMEQFDLRTAVSTMMFDLFKDIQNYIKKGGENKKTIEEATNILLKSLTPFIPHTCEELTGEEIISNKLIPKVQEEKINLALEKGFEITQQLENDIKKVMELAKITPKKITIFVASEWKRNAWNKTKAMKDIKTVVPTLMKDEEMKLNGQTAVRYAQWLQKHFHEIEDIISTQEELTAIENAKQQLEKTFNAEIIIIESDKAEQAKAGNAMPNKPAILVE